jgi:membrane protein
MDQTERLAEEEGRGRQAERPHEIPGKGWRDILCRIWTETSQNRIFLICAGATFYLLLALFPALAAFISIYGFVADPVTVADHVAFLAGLMPKASLDMVKTQLQALAQQKTGSLSTAFLIGLGIALWSANNGIKALFEAMNVAYGEAEKRSFLGLNAISMLFTLGAIVVGIVLIAAVGVIPALLAILHVQGWEQVFWRIARWPFVLVATIAGTTLLYRYGPSREKAKWRWLSWGAAIASLTWLLTSAAFSFYLENFANYDATYGTLGAVIGFMMWTWISVIVLVLGAQLNAEMEHQTTKDTTTGPPRPMGSRGAVMADTIGPSADA